jgi:hypothetical protein
MPVDEINEIIGKRNIPSAPLEPYFSIQPVSTKFQLFPSSDRRERLAIPHPTHSVNDVFNPGTKFAPWSGYVNNVNTEMRLQNRYFALQRADQALFVPSSKSELYRYDVRSDEVEQPHEGLFDNGRVDGCRNAPPTGSERLFGNSTRQELRTLPLRH